MKTGLQCGLKQFSIFPSNNFAAKMYCFFEETIMVSMKMTNSKGQSPYSNSAWRRHAKRRNHI